MTQHIENKQEVKLLVRFMAKFCQTNFKLNLCYRHTYNDLGSMANSVQFSPMLQFVNIFIFERGPSRLWRGSLPRNVKNPPN